MTDVSAHTFSNLVREPSLSDKVSELLTDAITSGKLRPGDRLPAERELGDQFGVSRTVIREAVRSLAARGLVRVTSGRGIEVSRINSGTVAASMRLLVRGHEGLDYGKVHEARTAVEVQAAGLAALLASPEDLSRLRQVCDDQQHSLEAGDLAAASEHDYQFHRELSRASGNELQLAMLDSISDERGSQPGDGIPARRRGRNQSPSTDTGARGRGRVRCFSQSHGGASGGGRANMARRSLAEFQRTERVQAPHQTTRQITMNARLEGRRAIVTGGGSGIGRAVAIRLAEDGAAVGVLDINIDAAQQVARRISDSGRKSVALRVDVSAEEQVVNAVNQVTGEFGGLDIVIANAGVMLFGRDTVATELDLETWRTNIDVNLTGMFLTCKHGLRALLRNGGGSVVITGSPTGVLGCAPTYTAYSTSKAGTFGLMRILAADYVKHNIRVNAVMPGSTNSPLITTLLEDPGKRAEFLGKIPMGRAAEPREIANVIAFLASDEASFVTGAAWFADGGHSAI
jgi:NAD(P)-dependent dehydrogenase (short-subunit alcohol dehydrogenase family)/DNA-binding FadR family transcriptional regulator